MIVNGCINIPEHLLEELSKEELTQLISDKIYDYELRKLIVKTVFDIRNVEGYHGKEN